MRGIGRRTRRALTLATVPVALLGSGLVVWQASSAAFKATTLGTWVLFTVDSVNGNAGDAANPTCTSFPTGSSYLYGTNGTTTSQLGSFPTDYASAAGTQWSNASTGQVKWYRLSWLIPNT